MTKHRSDNRIILLPALMICMICSPAWAAPATPIAGSLVSWGDGLTDVPAGNDFVAIAANGHHSLAIQVPEPASLALLALALPFLSWRSRRRLHARCRDCRAPLAALFAVFVMAAPASADIFQWEYINPADPNQGKRQSTTLAPDGAGAAAEPHASWMDRNLTMAYLIGADLTGVSGTGANLTEAELSDANLTEAGFGPSFSSLPNLTRANLSRANLTNAGFLEAILSEANLTGAEVRRATFIRVTGLTAEQLYSTASYQRHDLTGLALAGAGMNLSGWNFAGQNLTEGQYIASTLSGANLVGANLTGAYFSGATLTDADLREATFSGTFFTGATLSNADLRGTDLSGVSFYTATMTNANLSGANVRGTGFEASNISLAQLYSTASYSARDLTGIRLGQTTLHGAQFSGLDFTGARFNEATLSNADLSQANLTNAQFSVATLTGANLAGSIVRGAYLDNTTGFTKEQLYSTASYQSRDLVGITLDHNDLTSRNFANQNLNQASFVRATLQNTDFRQANLSEADFSYATMTGANLAGADVRGADFRTDSSQPTGITAAQLYSTVSYQARDLAGINLSGNNMVGWNFFGQNLNSAFLQASLNNADFRQANLTNANFGPAGNFLAGASLTSADFTGTEVRGASFGNTTGFTLAQLYSTASYQRHDLTGVRFDADFAVNGFNFEGANFAWQNLTDARFQNARLGGADFSGAQIQGAHFGSTVEIGFTAGQLYSTASYQGHDLAGLRLPNNDLSGWNFAGQNLTGANLSFANLSNADLSQGNLTNVLFQPSIYTVAGADLSGADARGSDLNDFALEESNARNLIRADGHIAGLDLTASALLVIRDYDGNPAANPPNGPLPIVVEQQLAMDATGTLRLVFDADPWDSTISFTPGIPITRDGTLELAFAVDVNPSSLLGRTIDLFDWTGVTATGAFSVSSPYAWDVSKLYTTGEVTLVAVPEPTSFVLLAFCALFLSWRKLRAQARLVYVAIALLATSQIARADIYQWEYTNPADPSHRKQQSAMLAPDGAGVNAVPGADLSNRNLTMSYLIGANLSAYWDGCSPFGCANVYVSNLTGANLTFADLTNANLYLANLTNTNLTQANLTNAFFDEANLENADFSQANLTNAHFGGSTLTGASLTNAEVRGASFGSALSGTGIALPQLYSTASYQAQDLTGIGLFGNNLAGANLVAQKLTDANLIGATLTGADLSHANLSRAYFTADGYFGVADLTGANLSQANLTDAYFAGSVSCGEECVFIEGANLTNANLSSADARGANFYLANTLAGANTSNMIQSDAHIGGLDLTAGASLIVRDYDGNSGPLPIIVEEHLAMDASGALRLVFDADPWDSTISFAPGIPVALGGALELSFADDVNLASQVGRTIDLFDWTDVMRTGALLRRSCCFLYASTSPDFARNPACEFAQK